jgi:hypothetical protein
MKPHDPQTEQADPRPAQDERAAGKAPRPNVSVQIDRLVLDGITLGPGDATRVRRALETELGRLLADAGICPALAVGASVPAVDAGGVEIDQSGPTSLGRRIAQAVYRGIGP